ncbi:MAG: outer membrane lipoprotein-sorting protein, partial [FCB group bacterium]|nr:outer membrane lipoprotein-sorting protein [FCB group bacterium]
MSIHRISFFVLLSAMGWSQTDPQAALIVQKMSALMSPPTSRATMTQTIQTSSGKKRTMEFEMFSADTGKSILMRYSKPTSIKGQTFLMLNDANDIWTYFPRTRRVRKLASSSKNQKVQGSDFNFSDFSSGDTWTKDYTSTVISEEKFRGEACWKLEARETPSNDSDYPRVIYWVRKSDYSPLEMDFYNDSNVHEKTLSLENIEVIENIPTAKTMVMKNLLENSETVMKVLSITYQWT